MGKSGCQNRRRAPFIGRPNGLLLRGRVRGVAYYGTGRSPTAPAGPGPSGRQLTAAVGEGTPRGGVASVGPARGGVGIRAQNFTLSFVMAYLGCILTARSLRGTSTPRNSSRKRVRSARNAMAKRPKGDRFREELIGVETPRGNWAVRTQR